MQKPSKSVLIVATQFMRTGGIESHLAEFARQFTRAGIATDVVILNAPDLKAVREAFAGMNGRLFAFESTSSVRRMLAMARLALRIAAGGYSAIYSNGQGRSIQLIKRCNLRGLPWTHHHHTAGDAEDQSTWPVSYREAMTECDHLICCSQRNGRSIQQAIAREPAVVACFSRAVDAPSRQLGSREALRFGYFGRLIPEKGIDVLKRLASDPDTAGIEFDLWGFGDAYSPADFEGLPRLHFHGGFSGRQELETVVAGLDAYLLISRHPEGLPIALLEVMSAGVPWIATDRGGISDIACGGRATRLLRADPDYAEVKGAVLELAKDIREGGVNRESQRAHYQKHFSADVVVAQWRQVLGVAA